MVREMQTARRNSLSMRRGFSFVEVTIVSGLMAVLAVLLANAWYGLGHPLVETVIRARLAQEANLALNALSRDLGGSLSDADASTGSKTLYQFVGRMQPGGSQLWLCFDGGTSPNGLADWAS